MNLDTFKQDFIERFMKFETLIGLVRIPAGLLILFTLMYHLQFAMQVYFAVQAGAMVLYGIRQVFVNRVKEQAKLKQQVAQRIQNVGQTPSVG
jgi:zinc transporter ZupT